MRQLCAGLALLCAACSSGDPVQRADAVFLAPSDDTFSSVAPATSAAEIIPIVDRGLQIREKGPDATRFIVIRAGDRHPPEVKDKEFHVVVGAGVRMPKGAMRIRKVWIASGMMDGVNEEFQTMAIAIMVERGAPRPFEPEVVEAVGNFCAALAARVPIHPDCVVGMGEVPYMRPHEAEQAEAALAASARARVPVPETDGEATITTGKGTISVTYETRDTFNGIRVGLMMRRRFDGPNRGMLFIYPFPDYRHFWMRNCFIPIDVAYLLDGKIEQIEAMRPEAGTPPDEIPRYPSQAAHKYCLEMPGGWFANNGVSKGDRISLDYRLGGR